MTTMTSSMQGFTIQSGKTVDKFLAEHFVYEITMLFLAGSKLDKIIAKRDKFKQGGNNLKEEECNREINMALEAFVIHWRALIEFFYIKNKKYPQDDMRASDFVVNTNR